MMETKDKLKDIIQDAKSKLFKIEDKEKREENLKLVGKYFKFRNSYGSGDKWWLYAYVTKLNRSELQAIKFQTDCYGKIDIEIDKYFRSTRYTEIKKEEFKREWKKILSKINNLNVGL